MSQGGSDALQSTSKGYLFLAIVVALTIASVLGYKQREYSYGLDIQGGTRLTYRLKNLKPEQQKELPTIMSNLVRILGNRVSQTLGVVEGNIQPKGEDELVVDLPGYTDAAKARETMSSTASIKLYWAKNVVTNKKPWNPYEKAGRLKDDKTPIEQFIKKSDPSRKPFGPENPEYKRMIDGWELILEGTDLAKASAQVEAGNNTQPNFEFSTEGARKLEAFCRKTADLEENIAFVLDGKVLSIAFVKQGTILSEHAFVEGQFDPAYVNNLVSLLNAGALPVELEETSNQVVDPTIGSYAKNQMITAGVVSFAIIAVFLLGYYAFPGFVALLALCLYILFTLTVMKLVGATFSLAAIAGFILSVGMAVDANILVFERTKEEMRDGRSLLTAVELGFKRALPAIFDSNACTIMTSVVLYRLGTGPVQGFASTLILGVVISLFTAFTITRSLLVFFVSSGIANKPEWFALQRQWFGQGTHRDHDHNTLQVVNNSKKFFGISLLTIIPGLIFVVLGGIKPNVEFQGGYEAEYKVNSSATVTGITADLEKHGFPGSNAKIVSQNNQKYASVTVPPNALKAGDPDAYNKIAAASPTLEKLPVNSITSIGPSVQKETLQNAILAVIISSTLIVFYLAVRFGSGLGGFKNGVKFGGSAIIALGHDIFVVIGVAAIVGKLLGWEISALFITAMLTMVGFSVHDTIVIFDRIRENLRKPGKGEDFEALCNRSITQSFARSINTSGTVLVTLLVLVFWGAATVDLKFFCLTMFIGILSGTYSSIYNATPILYLLDRRVAKSKGHEHSLIEEATAEMNRLKALAMQTTVGAPSTTTLKPGSGGGRGYATTKRKDSAVDRSKIDLDDE